MLSGHGRHRKPRQAPAFVVTAGVTGSALALPFLASTAAHGADSGTWDRLAACESGGAWSANTGNGFHGGLQISQRLWERHGGLDFAERADLASRSQQIAVAEKILEAQGIVAWDTCGPKVGLTAADAEPSEEPSAPSGEPTGDGSAEPSADPSTEPSAEPDDPDDPDSTEDPATPEDPEASEGAEAPEAPDGSEGDSASPEPEDSASPEPGDSTSPSPEPEGTETPSPDTSAPGEPGEATTNPSEPEGSEEPGESDEAGEGSESGDGAEPGNPDPTDSVDPTELPDPSTGTPDSDPGETDTSTPSEGPDRPSPGESSTPEGGDSGSGGEGSGRHRGDPHPGDADGAAGPGERPGRHSRPGDSSLPASGSYTVRPGDTLSAIAETYGTKGGWPALHDLNLRIIGEDADLILPGQRLALTPERDDSRG